MKRKSWRLEGLDVVPGIIKFIRVGWLELGILATSWVGLSLEFILSHHQEVVDKAFLIKFGASAVSMALF